MSASGDALVAAPEPAYALSAYADQMPKLREFAALASTDPQRGMLREELILAFLPVVEHLARRHASSHASVEELTQVGTVALITAIDRWDPGLARGEFLGYLIPCVRGEMLRWFRDRTWSTRVPRRLKDLTVAIGRASGPLSQESRTVSPWRSPAQGRGAGDGGVVRPMGVGGTTPVWAASESSATVRPPNPVGAAVPAASAGVGLVEERDLRQLAARRLRARNPAMRAGKAGSVSSVTEVAEPTAGSTAFFLPAIEVEARRLAARARS
jgi:RNA polymerase sigma factor (sigma-70 family)